VIERGGSPHSAYGLGLSSLLISEKKIRVKITKSYYQHRLYSKVTFPVYQFFFHNKIKNIKQYNIKKIGNFFGCCSKRSYIYSYNEGLRLPQLTQPDNYVVYLSYFRFS